MSSPIADAALLHTPLHGLHLAHGARMVGFAGYDMPVQYPSGIVAEHLHTRSHAGLFDVSHMGQAILEGHNASAALERLVPGDFLGLAKGRMRYTQLLDGDGNILDDLMVTRLSGAPGGFERLFLVVNAGTKLADFAHIAQALPHLRLAKLEDRGLIALQGPEAAKVLARRFPHAAAMPFMSMHGEGPAGHEVYVSRCGYTGEDGFEISAPVAALETLAKSLLAEPGVLPIGLGARDSLRLEAGLCLYGHDIDTTRTPVEAGLAWSIGKRRQIDGGFPGDERVRLQIAHGPEHLRVGLLLEGKAPAREGADVVTLQGVLAGRITSGGFSPTLGRPIAMGYVATAHAGTGTRLDLMVRGKALPAHVVPMPFVVTRYYRGK